MRRQNFILSWDRHRLDLGTHTRIMGILNVTPDSFSDGGAFFTVEDAVAQGEKMAAEGADIIDVGGESTRPFADEVSVEEEIRRVVPVIEALSNRISVPISIDTTKAVVAERALRAGASMINDISALKSDPGMGPLASRWDVPVILMHMKGSPKTMQVSPVYGDLVGEIKSFLADAVQRAESAGIARSNIIVDPGIGFGKTVGHNFTLLDRLAAFQTLEVPILVGPSRKSFIRNTLKGCARLSGEPDTATMETGTQAAVSAAVLNGAHIVRVHEVAATRVTIAIIDALVQQRNGS